MRPGWPASRSAVACRTIPRAGWLLGAEAQLRSEIGPGQHFPGQGPRSFRPRRKSRHLVRARGSIALATRPTGAKQVGLLATGGLKFDGKNAAPTFEFWARPPALKQSPTVPWPPSGAPLGAGKDFWEGDQPTRAWLLYELGRRDQATSSAGAVALKIKCNGAERRCWPLATGTAHRRRCSAKRPAAGREALAIEPNYVATMPIRKNSFWGERPAPRSAQTLLSVSPEA